MSRDNVHSVGWVELLAAGAGLVELEEHRQALIVAGTPASQADAEARAAVEVTALLQQRQQRLVELAALNDIASQLASVSDPADLLAEVVDQARRLLGVDLTYLALLTDDDLSIEVASGARSPHLVGTRLRRWAGLVGSVVSSGEARWSPDYRADTSLVHEASADRAAEAESIRGLLGVPLAVRGRVLGVLLAAKREERRFGREEISLLEGLAAHAAVAIDNARAGRELRDAKEVLEATIRLDAELTRTVLVGGDPATLVQRMQTMTDARLRWVDPEQVPDPTVAGQDDPVDVVQPVVAAGELLGALVLEPAENVPVPAEARLLVERAAPVIALTLVGARATARVAELGRDIALIDLLSRTEPDPAADRRRMRGAGLDPRVSHLVVVVEGEPGPARRFVSGLGLGNRVAVAVHRGQLVLVLPADLALQERWPGPESPTAGLAGPAEGAGGLRDAYGQASRTARALTALGRSGVLGRAEELGVFAVLLSRTGRREVQDQLVRELGPVLAEERLRGVPLLQTLETYLDLGRRPTATAAALSVHVNTVYQRLATLDRLLGAHWRQRALDLQVLLRLHRAAHDLETE
jgi:hypothetical protein